MMKKIVVNLKVEIALAVLVLFITSVFCYFADFSFIIPLLLLILGVYLFFFKKANIRLFCNMGLLLALIVFAANSIKVYSTIPYFYIPVASIGMITILLYKDLQLAFIMALLSSILVTLTIGGTLEHMLTFFLGSLSAVYFSRDARMRSQLLIAGLFCGVIQVVTMVLFNPTLQIFLSREYSKLYINPLALSGLVSSLIVLSVLKIFELLFGELTNFSLLELSDFNQPLLRKMILETPGTYHHSLVVSNLAESAANEIGANALLVRVGSYYHDIGKLGKPEYFTENQLACGNKHDDLEPSMSRLVILNHVKDGVDTAKKYKLNPRIVDFITQHHGTGLIYYFFQRALEEGDGKSIKEENFRYPGPKPQTREAAIVLLADSVEGATRAIDDPTPNKIDDVVRKVINNKFIDGQLDECNLTLKDINLISVVFTRVLTAMYHNRIKYPENKNDKQNSNKKSSEENNNQSHQNNQDHQENS